MAADKTFEAYESIAGESLARVTTQPVQHLIGGERRSSLDGSTFENTSPVLSLIHISEPTRPY